MKFSALSLIMCWNTCIHVHVPHLFCTSSFFTFSPKQIHRSFQSSGSPNPLSVMCEINFYSVLCCVVLCSYSINSVIELKHISSSASFGGTEANESRFFSQNCVCSLHLSQACICLFRLVSILYILMTCLTDICCSITLL